jgi:conjugative element/phage-associated large polyvalent protein
MSDTVKNYSATSPHPGVERRPLNEMRQVGAPKGPPDHTIPDHLGQHYHKDGNAFRSAYKPEKIEFVDRGTRMHAYFPISTFTVRAMAETAEARGWKEIEVTGTKQFQQSAYVEAASRGIGVRGYEPTEKDAEILARRQDRKDAAENPVVKAFLTATTEKEKKTAVSQYPQLKTAFEVDADAKKFAEVNLDSKKASQAFVDRTRDNIAIQLHRGQEIKLAKPTPEKSSERKAPEREQQQDQGRSR